MENNFLKAVDLMKARYEAFGRKDIEFIVDTHNPETRDQLDIKETKRWAEGATWLGLDILYTEKGESEDDYGIVEFNVTFSEEGETYIHHEKSEFHKRDGKWFYTGWVPQGTIVKGKKIGANEPCPCGSGKKYKKCCGK
ncbi:MAG: YchJ family metal-binding protein [Fusobacteriaceae bacterium]